MKKRIGSKTYDTDKADLIETRQDGVQIFRKKAGMREFFLFDPNAKTTREMFRDLPADQAAEYLPKEERSRMVRGSNSLVRFSDYDMERIRSFAAENGLSISKFLLMLVDEYERRMK